jgi:chromosome segregation ATPase
VDERLQVAMDRIKEEINASHGVYSLTGRGPSIQMVLWRAGFSKSFLEKKGQDVKRDKIQTERKDRIRRWKRFILSSSQLADTVATLESEVKAAAPETDEYRQSLHDTELELVEAHIEIQELRAEMAKLQSEIKELMAGTNDT